MRVSVSDSRGHLVFEKRINVGSGYAMEDIDLGYPAPGIYMVTVRDASGKRVATERLMIRR